MTETASRDRMISAAATLFARAGFHGVTTKDIAHHANVSEGNIFRYFPSKRDLFVGVIDSELRKLSAETSASGASDPEVDPRTALRTLFETVAQKVLSKPELVRLLQFSALEFGPEMEPIYRKYLGNIVSASTTTLTRWSERHGFSDVNVQIAVFSFVASVVMLQGHPIIGASMLPFPSIENAAAEYAGLWYRALRNETGMTDAIPVHEDVVER